MAILEVRGLVKTYESGETGVAAIRGVDLAVEPGEIFGVVGPSGSGKSTFIRCLNLLERPTKGEVIFQGESLTDLSPAKLKLVRQDMGLIFQAFNLMASRTAAANVAFPLEVAGLGKKEIALRVAELLELVGLKDKAKNYPAQLSGGEKQRVGVARALANHPKVLLSDEATSALDPQSTRAILSLIKDVKLKFGLTVILITHEPRVIASICDRVAVLEKGLVVETGPVEEVFANPNHPVTQSFVAEILGAEEDLSDLKARGHLVRLKLQGESPPASFMASLNRDFQLEAQILKAHVERIKGVPLGSLVLDLMGEEPNVKRALTHLKTLGLLME
ncbi:MAG: ATP-binding cassette domain-containing protein [Deltaproteobacteria bacterium]|jgi:D-methionine transport system ATP-binding protein|nr:ATP-binding cassette domain-containing protein [Deltaproteobacteria bacterium]